MQCRYIGLLGLSGSTRLLFISSLACEKETITNLFDSQLGWPGRFPGTPVLLGAIS